MNMAVKLWSLISSVHWSLGFKCVILCNLTESGIVCVKMCMLLRYQTCWVSCGHISYILFMCKDRKGLWFLEFYEEFVSNWSFHHVKILDTVCLNNESLFFTMLITLRKQEKSLNIFLFLWFLFTLFLISLLNAADYCLSNDYINSIITHQYQFDGGDLASYYVSFLRLWYLPLSLCFSVDSLMVRV